MGRARERLSQGGPRPRASEATSKRAERAVERFARETGGRAVSGSGNQPGKPGDVGLQAFLAEHKTTTAKSRTLRVDELAKIEREALSKGKLPCFVVEFTEAQASLRGTTWVCFPAYAVRDLLEGKR